MFEVECPACGGITEGVNLKELYLAAREHTMADHGYDVPRDHVVADAHQVDD
jgi:hypothetical protein